MGLTTNHAGTAESTCCILPEIKSFLLLSDVTNVTDTMFQFTSLESVLNKEYAWSA